ncbi:hypothetical protein L6164_010495 [Bauhinia variegata]|nr:hypothetical protein L6164_010495 [Bauhinia variegata]
MGCSSEALRMSLIFIFVLLSLQSTHILTAEALFNEAGSFHFHALSEMYFMEENGQENENHIKKISGQDENEEKEALIVEKFRALLGLKSFHTRRPSDGDSLFVSPSPSPSPGNEVEAPAPAPLPVPHVRAHPHHPRRHSHWKPPPHKIHDGDRGRARRTIVAVLVSVGVAAVIFALGLVWFYRKYRSQRKKPKRTTPLYSKNRGNKGNSRNSSSKVSVNSGLDLFYLNALGTDVEQLGCSTKQTSEAVSRTSNHSSPKCSIYEKRKENQEVTVSDNGSSCSGKEILSVHEDVGSVKYDSESESDGDNSSSGDKIIPMESHSSDDESFHSLADSHSSNVRLSHASAGRLSGTSSPRSSQASLSKPSLADSSFTPTHQDPCSPQNSVPNTQSPHVAEGAEQRIEAFLQRPQRFALPSPPPLPPPPPPRPMPLFALHSLSRTPSQSPRSSIFHNLSSPTTRNSGSSLGKNQMGENDLPSSSQSNPIESPPTPSIPPPPRPPPFFNGKTPPPPPAQLPQFTPRGKDGAGLPKLKPLHWDKVRAAPDRTTVWDKLRTSSFE